MEYDRLSNLLYVPYMTYRYDIQCHRRLQGVPADWNLALDRMGSSTLAGEKMALLEGLACTKNLTLLTAYLDYSISEECKVRTQDKVGRIRELRNNLWFVQRYLYLAIGRAPGGGKLMLSWLQTNWQQISDFYGDSFVYNVKNMVSVESRAICKIDLIFPGGWSRRAGLVRRRSSPAAKSA